MPLVVFKEANSKRAHAIYTEDIFEMHDEGDGVMVNFCRGPIRDSFVAKGKLTDLVKFLGGRTEDLGGLLGDLIKSVGDNTVHLGDVIKAIGRTVPK